MLIFVYLVKQFLLPLDSENNHILICFGLLCVMLKQQQKMSFYVIVAFLTINDITTIPRLWELYTNFLKYAKIGFFEVFILLRAA